jgi:hypothetical protein
MRHRVSYPSPRRRCLEALSHVTFNSTAMGRIFDRREYGDL